MRKYLSLVLLSCLALLSVLSSCDEKPVAARVVEYSTPTIKGKISIPEGSDVKPEEVYVKVIDSDDRTVTIQKAQSDNTFVIQNLTADIKYRILFTSEEPEFNNRSVTRGKGNGVGGWMHDVVPAIKEGNDIGSVKLKNLGTIKGKATVDGETDQYDTTVYIPGTSYSAITDKDGSFSIYSVPEGTYTLRYTHEGCVAVMSEDVMLICPDGEENPEKTVGDVVLHSNKGTVQGKAVLGDANDSTGITIKLESEDKSFSYDSSTSSDGTYVIASVAPGRYRIIASYSGYLSQYTDYFTVENATLTTVAENIVLYRNAGTIMGSVVLSDNAGNSAGISVSIVNVDGSNRFSVTTSADGSFTKKVKAGAYTVTATYPGYVSQSAEVTVTENSVSDVIFSGLVPSSGAVSGFVTLEGSSDNSGVVITLTDSSDSKNVYSEVSGADGSFRISGIKKTGTYLLTYSKDGYVSNLSNSVDVTVGKVITADSVTLKSIMSTVSGRIQLEGASSYENTTILLKNDSNQYTATTDQKGEYMVNRVLPGTYTLMASKDGYVTASTKEFVVESSSEKEVELLSLSVAVRSVTGKVSLELGTDHAGALVTATNLSDSKIVYSAITNSNGDYTLAGMIPGEYQIVISKNGYVTATLPTKNIVANTLTDAGATELAIAKGEITGIARLEGCSDYSGINVSIVGTSFETVTAKDGTYSFTVPTGNYSGGIRFEYDDFETTSYVSNIAVLQTTSYSDAYAVPDQELRCLRVPKVSGKVTISGLTKAQYDNITVTITELPEFTYITGEDGTYTFEHVPVGTYTFEFTRENARKVTKMVMLEAAPEIKIENIELIPDAVTLYGNILLTGVADYSGVTVRITTPDSVELKTVTNAAGYWYISNIVASKSHTITFEKTGWESQLFDITANSYAPLSETDYNDEHPVTLTDTVAPVITSLTATVGKSTERGREIFLCLYNHEEGSGIKCIQGNTSDSFEGVTEQTYYNPFKFIIPDEIGDKTIYVRVKDAAGNISDTVSTTVVLKNDKTELNQALSGDKLHLTYENSPYVMTDNILVPEGETLVIDPGVEIQVNGEYYIQVEGTLSAVGTEDKPIKIYGIDDGQDKWKGIRIIKDNDTEITHAEITGLTEGIQGYGSIDSSTVTAANGGYVLGYCPDGYWDSSTLFYGRVLSSNVSGKINASVSDILHSIINSDNIKKLDASGSIFNNEFKGALCGIITGSLIQNTFTGSGNLSFMYAYMMNNGVDVSDVTVIDSVVKYTTFNNASLDLRGGTWSHDTLNNCTFSSYSAYRLNDSNLIGCGTVTISTLRSERSSFDMSYNYWGDDKTVELEQKEESEKVSFIHQYPDDFNLAVVDWSEYSKTALTDCGYQGKGFLTEGSYSGYSIGDTGPAGGIVFYDKGYYSDGWRYLEAAPDNVEGGYYYFGYYRVNGINLMVGTSTALGSGKDNTDYLVEAMDIEGKAYSSSDTSDTTTSEYAARKCFDYESGGYSDWFLPSKDELNLIYTNLHKNGLGGFDKFCVYWSSSEGGSSVAWYQNFSNGYQSSNYRGSSTYVRPIRVF